MRILFCNIAWMKFYKGVQDHDTPINGGSYIKEHQDGGEVFNFDPVEDEADGGSYCYGYVETKFNKKPVKNSSDKRHNELHIENIEGCALMKEEAFVEDVLVVFCAKPDRGTEKTDAQIIGWYKHAKVYREHQNIKIDVEDGTEISRMTNIIAKKEDVVLLPTGIRSKRTMWWAPRTKENKFGFGQANVWYPANNETVASKNYISRVVKQIEEYCGENWVDKYICLCTQF